MGVYADGVLMEILYKVSSSDTPFQQPQLYITRYIFVSPTQLLSNV